MRTISSSLEDAQKLDDGNTIEALYKLVLTAPASGGTTVTYGTDRILSIEHTEEPYHQEAIVVLDNSDGNVADDLKGHKGVISYGEGPNLAFGDFSPAAPLFVTGQEHHTSQGFRMTTLTLKGIPDLLDEDRASAQVVLASSDTQTVKDIITAILGATHTAFDHTVSYTASFDEVDDLFDTVTPADAFTVEQNDTRLDAIRRLLFFTRTLMRVEDDGEVHFFAPTNHGDTWQASTAYQLNDYVSPTDSDHATLTWRCTTAGTSGGSEPTWDETEGNTTSDGTVVWTAIGLDYVYEHAVTDAHNLFASVVRERLVMPNKVVVSSHPDSGDGFTGSASFTESSGITDMEKQEFYFMNVASDAQAASVAAAILATYRLSAQTGSAEVPLNVGQEVHDWVKVVDSRSGKTRFGNVGVLHRTAGRGRWRMKIAFGEAGTGGFLGLLPPITARGALEIGDIPSLVEAVQKLHADMERLKRFLGVDTAVRGSAILDGSIDGILKLIDDSVNANKINVIGLDATGALVLSAVGSGDLSDLPGDLDDISNGATFGKILNTHISAGAIKLTSETVVDGFDLDDVPNGSTFERVLATHLSAGRILLTSDTQVSGEWYDQSGVEIDANNGINIYGTDSALTTRATKGGTIQCKVDSQGRIVAGGGAVLLDSGGIEINGTSNLLNFRNNVDSLVGFIASASDGLDVFGGVLHLLASNDAIFDVGGAVLPVDDGLTDLGSASKVWGNGYIDTVRTDHLKAVAGGNVDIDDNLEPTTANTFRCGTSTFYWSDVFSDTYHGKVTTIQSFEHHDDLALVRAIKPKMVKVRRLEGLGRDARQVEVDREIFDPDTLPEEVLERDSTGAAQFVKMGAMHGFLIGAFKKLTAQSDQDDARIGAMEAENAALRARIEALEART